MQNPPGQKVAVLGLGISGTQSALFLQKKGFKVFASDAGCDPALDQKVLDLKAAGVEAECGGHTLEKILGADWSVISPGIPPDAPVYKALQASGKPVFSEIEAAAWFCPSENIVAVTGSSGKTTVTTLIYRSLVNSGKRAHLCGNIGNPWIGELEKIKPEDVVVLELSSFQLAHCRSFRPKTGVLLNLTPNHQDWHPDMQDYANAKLRLFTNQFPDGHAVIRKKDEAAFFPAYPFKARKFYFGEDPAANPNDEVVKLVAGLWGCPAAVVDKTIKEFEGIEHRLEKVIEYGGAAYVNDSKCTTAASLAWALEKYPDGRVLLLAGGHPKSKDFDTVRGLVAKKVKKAFLIGEAQPILKEAWQGACELSEPRDFVSAVRGAAAEAKAGDVVLLSPACASFDMFKNYMERGKLFKQIVSDISRTEAAGKK